MAVYLLLGDDEERKARSVEKLSRGRAVRSVDASETGPEEVISACNSGNLFGEGNFVVVRRLDAWSAHQKSLLAGYLENPAPDTDLVLLGERLGSRERLLAAAKRAGEVHTLSQPAGKELLKWVVRYAREQGIRLSQEVARELAARCSEDKLRLAREIEKLALYREAGEATLEDVEALCAPNLEADIFSFVDALASGDRHTLLSLLERLFSAGEPPLRLTFMVRRQFDLLARAKALYARGTPRQEVAQRLGVPPFVARKLEEQSQKIGEEKLEESLTVVLELERGLKGASALRPELQVELAVMKLSG